LEKVQRFSAVPYSVYESEQDKRQRFNTPRIGGFLAYYLAPQIKTFSDTRDDLFVGTGVLEATEAF